MTDPQQPHGLNELASVSDDSAVLHRDAQRAKADLIAVPRLAIRPRVAEIGGGADRPALHAHGKAIGEAGELRRFAVVQTHFKMAKQAVCARRGGGVQAAPRRQPSRSDCQPWSSNATRGPAVRLIPWKKTGPGTAPRGIREREHGPTQESAGAPSSAGVRAGRAAQRRLSASRLVASADTRDPNGPIPWRTPSRSFA